MLTLTENEIKHHKKEAKRLSKNFDADIVDYRYYLIQEYVKALHSHNTELANCFENQLRIYNNKFGLKFYLG